MRTRILFLLLLGSLITAFAALNWAAFTAPSMLSVGVATIEAPLGVTMLGLLVLMALVFAVYAAFWQGTALLGGAERISRRPRGGHRHEPHRARSAPDPHGPQRLALLLDRSGRQAHGHRAKLDRHLPLARHRPIHVPHRRAAAGRPASRKSRRRPHAQAVEGAVRRQPHALRLARAGLVSKYSACLPLTKNLQKPGNAPSQIVRV